MSPRTVCWAPLWCTHAGLGGERLQLSAGRVEGVVLAVDDARGPFRLRYRLQWDAGWQLTTAALALEVAGAHHHLDLRTDGHGCWTTRACSGALLPRAETLKRGALPLAQAPKPEGSQVVTFNRQ